MERAARFVSRTAGAPIPSTWKAAQSGADSRCCAAIATARWRSWIARSRASPDNPALLLNRAAILGATVRYAGAQRDLQRVLRADPNNAKRCSTLGIVPDAGAACGAKESTAAPRVEVEPGRARPGITWAKRSIT